MAAILCDTIGKGCKGLCDCLVVPCRACGEVCKTSCGVFGEACKGCNEAFRDCCQTSCDALSKVCCSPFFPYIAFTVVVNLPPVIWGLQSLLQCTIHTGPEWWLWINALLCIGHMVGSIHIAHTVQTEEESQTIVRPNNNSATGTATETTPIPTTAAVIGDETPGGTAPIIKVDDVEATATPVNDSDTTALGTSYQRFEPQQFVRGIGSEDGSHANSLQRLTKVLCYDVGVAIYMMAAIVWIAWQWIGWGKAVAESFDGDNNNGDGGAAAECESNTERWISFSVVCGAVYLSLVTCFFCCSFCCLR